MSKIKSLAGDTVLYGLGSIVPRVINFFLIVPHTSVFEPEAYSVIVDLYAIAAFLNVICTFGFETTYFRFATREGANHETVFNQAQTAVILLTILFTVPLILLAPSLANRLYISGHPDYIIWLTCIVAIDALVAIPFARLRLERKALLFAVAKIVNVSVIVLLNFYFLKVAYDPSIGVAYVFLINLIANALFIAFFFRTFLRWRPLIRWDLLRSMAIYAFPVMLVGLAGMTNEMFSRLMLDQWLPENFYPGQSNRHALGVFGAVYKLAVFMSIAITAFRYAAEPFFFSNASDRKSPVLFANINHYFIICGCILLLGVGVNLDILKYLLRDPDYWEGLNIVPVLLTGYLFMGVYYNFSVWYKLTDKTYYGTLITLFGALITVVANYFLIPVAGYMGSSIATLLCYFAMAALCYLGGKRYYPIPYRIVPGLSYIVVTLLLLYGIDALPLPGNALSFVIRNGIVLGFIWVAYKIEKRGLSASLAS